MGSGDALTGSAPHAGGLHSGGLNSGGLLSRATDFGSGTVLTRLIHTLGSPLWRAARRGGEGTTRDLKRSICLFEEGHWQILIAESRANRVGGFPARNSEREAQLHPGRKTLNKGGSGYTLGSTLWGSTLWGSRLQLRIPELDEYLPVLKKNYTLVAGP